MAQLTRYWSNSGTTDCYRRRLHPAISRKSSSYPRRCCGNDASPGLLGPRRRRLRRTRRPPACRCRRRDGPPTTGNRCLCRRGTTMTTTTTTASCHRHRRTCSSRPSCSAIIIVDVTCFTVIIATTGQYSESPACGTRHCCSLVKVVLECLNTFSRIPLKIVYYCAFKCF